MILKLYEKILLTRILSEVSGRELLRNEQFGFRLQNSTALQLVHLVERLSTNFDEKKLTGAFFLDVAKTFVAV
jgi:hypothetical protein